MIKLTFLIIFLSFCAAKIKPAKILGIFPAPIKSHYVLTGALMEELARRGHQVTMITSIPSDDPPENYKEVLIDSLHAIKNEMFEKIGNRDTSVLTKIGLFFEFCQTLHVHFLKDTNLQNFLKSGEKYDLVIQIIGMNEATLGIAHVVNASSVIDFNMNSASPFEQWVHMTPAPYSYVPNLYLSYTDEMTFKERCINTLVSFLMDTILPIGLYQYEKNVYAEFFPDAPPLNEMVEKVDLHLFNTHVSTETPRPYMPNVKQIGGFVFNRKRNLSEDLQEFLDKSKRGLIYFSLGTNFNTSLIPLEKLNEFIQAFQDVPYDVIWKFDDELPVVLPNVLVKKWLPQNAILAHPNVKVFITHAGLGGTVEAIYNGVTMITLPLQADQFKNSAAIVKAGFGIYLDFEGITKEGVIGAIKEVINNKVYKEKIGLRSDIYRNQEMDPMDKAMFWIEHVLKHKGAKHLKAKAAQLYWYQYMLLDVLATIIIVIGLLSFLTWKIIRNIYRRCFHKNETVNQTKKKL